VVGAGVPAFGSRPNAFCCERTTAQTTGRQRRRRAQSIAFDQRLVGVVPSPPTLPSRRIHVLGIILNLTQSASLALTHGAEKITIVSPLSRARALSPIQRGSPHSTHVPTTALREPLTDAPFARSPAATPRARDRESADRRGALPPARPPAAAAAAASEQTNHDRGRAQRPPRQESARQVQRGRHRRRPEKACRGADWCVPKGYF